MLRKWDVSFSICYTWLRIWTNGGILPTQ